MIYKGSGFLAVVFMDEGRERDKTSRGGGLTKRMDRIEGT
jgi:hypothetical protein